MESAQDEEKRCEIDDMEDDEGKIDDAFAPPPTMGPATLRRSVRVAATTGSAVDRCAPSVLRCLPQVARVAASFALLEKGSPLRLFQAVERLMAEEFTPRINWPHIVRSLPPSDTDATWIDHREYRTLIGLNDCEELVSACLFVVHKATGGRSLYCPAFATCHEFRRQGIGKAMVSVLKSFAAESGCKYAATRRPRTTARGLLSGMKLRPPSLPQVRHGRRHDQGARHVLGAPALPRVPQHARARARARRRDRARRLCALVDAADAR